MPSADTQISYFGIPCWDEGTEENFRTYGRSTAVRTVRMKWEDRITFIDKVMAKGGVNLSQQPAYTEAAQYPDAPFLLFLDEMKITGEFGRNDALGIGFGGRQLTQNANGLVSYPYALCRLTFASRPWNQSSLSVTNLDYGTEDLTLPNRSLVWAASGDPVPETTTPVLNVVTVTIAITQYNQPSLPMTYLTNYVGKANSSPIFGLPAGTVLLNGIKSSQRITFSGATNVDITYPFVYMPVGWNNKINPATFTFDPVKFAITGALPFPLAELNSVLTGIVK